MAVMYPRYLDDNGKKLYRELMEQCQGRLEQLTMLCVAYQQWRLATQEVKEQGVTIPCRGGVKMNPAVLVQDKAYNQCVKMLKELQLFNAPPAESKALSKIIGFRQEKGDNGSR